MNRESGLRRDRGERRGSATAPGPLPLPFLPRLLAALAVAVLAACGGPEAAEDASSAPLPAASAPTDGALADRSTAAKTVLERLTTGAGELTLAEEEGGAAPVYTVRVAGDLVRRFDAGDEEDELAAFPLPSVLARFDPGVPPFDEVVLLQQQMMSNACNGGPLWFLGLRRDGSWSVSSPIDFCGGADPVVSREGERIRIDIPGGPANRGEGTVPGETWVYEEGEVRRIAGAGEAGGTAVG